jgi:cell shape-determining protein MreD
LSNIEQLAGAALMLVVAADLFVTVLYARIGSRVGTRFGMGFSRFIARVIWAVAAALASKAHRLRSLLLSMAAPVAVLAMLAFWAAMLTVGAAMIAQPELGVGLRRTMGETPTDFVSALYAAGSTLSIVSNSDFVPQTPVLRGLFLLNALIGASALSLTITYLMQIYRALQTRNALGLKLQAMSGGSRNAAELVSRWGPAGRFDTCYSSMAEIAGELAEVHEAHHLYPLLFYFRFDTDYPNPALYLPTLLEAATLMRCAIEENEYRWLQQSAVVSQLWHGPLDLLSMLERVFVPRGHDIAPDGLDGSQLDARFRSALQVLERNGVATTRDEASSAARYRSLVDSWHGKAHRVATYLAHDPESMMTEPGNEIPGGGYS